MASSGCHQGRIGAHTVTARMAGRFVAVRLRSAAVLRGLISGVVEPPPCVVCGRGRASTGWGFDPFGRISGRCSGCTYETPAKHDSRSNARQSFEQLR
jgi:hypothetical protein